MARRWTRTLLGPVRFRAVPLLIILAAGCSGGSSDDNITIIAAFDEAVPGGGGTFTAEGDNICSEGTFSNVDHNFVEERETNGVTARDQYNCADGSGNFFIIVEIETDASDLEDAVGPYAGTWTIETGNGLGDYKNTTGSGTLTGQFEPGWIDEPRRSGKYEGEFHTG